MERVLNIGPRERTGRANDALQRRMNGLQAWWRMVAFIFAVGLSAESLLGQQPVETNSGEAGTAQNVDSENSDSATPASADKENAEKVPAMPSLIEQLPDYSGDLSNRSFLLGDWGGTRTELAEKGIFIDFGLTQVFQGNAHGGKNTKSAAEYSGSLDFTFRFDTARMGLWPGGLLTLRGETWFGNTMHSHAGSIMSVNSDALFPVPGDSGKTTLSEYYLAQALSEKLVLVMGKMDLTRTMDQTAFASNETTQFMNLGLRVNPVLFPFGPYTTMTAAAVYMPTKWLKISTGINDNDPDGAATKTGFNTAFHGRDWYSIGQEYEIKIKPCGKEGHQRFGWAWTSRDYTALDSDGRLGLSDQLGPARRAIRLISAATGLRNRETTSDSYAFYYNFDQYVYTEADDPKQGLGFFGRFGYSTGEANPIEQFYSIGIGGRGIVPVRDNDTFGLGYYFVKLSDELPDRLNLQSEQGVELYYSIEVTPWFHLTPDVQFIVNPGGGFQNRDVAVVYGIRGQITF